MRPLITILFSIIVLITYGQEQTVNVRSIETYFAELGEVCFSFDLENDDMMRKLTAIISIDNVVGKTVMAYANQEEFNQFLEFRIPYKIVPHSSDIPVEITMLGKDNLKDITDWNFYPTYDAYISMMYQFAIDYPDLCNVFSIGNSVQGRQLVMAKISKNVNTREPEPQFLYTGTMHGDELAGYNFLLRMIDYLLTNYSVDPDVTYLLDNVEIWINPLSNPDGTYKGGNNTVNSSVRYNANNVDLNRNYPDPEDGPHPDGKAWQPETIAFMQLAEQNNFVMAGNTHGGEEVINYPWDTWANLTADNNWWIFVCREYVDTVHIYSPANYMTYLNNGITRGYSWYSISGGRQDYMNYFHNCREVTMELSKVKRLATSSLNTYWNYNYRSMINYIKQVTYGVAGTVTDLLSNEHVRAKITINGHDTDNSHVFSDSQNGFYQRLLDSGTYNITFSSPGYLPLTVEGVNVQRYQKTVLNVNLDPGPLNPVISSSARAIPIESTVTFTDESGGKPVLWEWAFQGGTPNSSSLKNPEPVLYSTAGTFDVKLSITNSNGEKITRVFEDYIRVAPIELMSNKSVTTCNSLFYDSGGENGSYGNNQMLTLTFLPGLSGAMVEADFLEFGLEASSGCIYDYLRIFNGSNTEAPLIGVWCGANSPGKISATNPAGSLTFQFKSDAYVTSTGWKALISCKTTEEIIIENGWSGISSYVVPIDTNIDTLFQSIIQDIVVVIGDDGIYSPELNIFTLQDWNSRQAYLVKSTSPQLLPMTGTLMLNRNISLNQGWNLVHIPTPQQIKISGIQSILNDDLIMIKPVADINLFWPQMGINSLTNLLPGKAYYFNVSKKVEFMFPAK